jgi:hypothetical protein
VHGILGLRLLVVLFSVAVVCIYRGKPPRGVPYPNQFLY